jgi:hypothetical protein
MSVPSHENVHIKLSLHGSQSLKITPGYYLMTVNETDAEVSDLDYFSFWQRRHVYVEVTFDCVHLGLS